MGNEPVREASPLPSERAYREVPTEVHSYRSGVTGGLLGGLAMVAVAFLYGVFSGRGFWFPVNLVAAALMRGLQQATPQELMQFNAGALAVALVVHLTVAMLLGLLFTAILPALPGPPILWAIVMGPALFVTTFFIILPVVNPAMIQSLDPLSFGAANVVYGLVMGLWVARSPKVVAAFGPDAPGRDGPAPQP